MSLGDRLRVSRKSRGLTQKELALKIGAKHNSVSNWEKGQNMPDPITIESLCAVLDITPNYLLMGEEQPLLRVAPQGFTAEETSLMRDYRALSEEGKGAVRALMAYYAAQAVPQPAAKPAAALRPERAQPALSLITGRISTQSVAAGTGTYLDPDAFEVITVQKNEQTNRTAFYVPVSGDSMEPRYHDGDILMVENTGVRPGEIGIFTLDGSGYVKMRGNGELLSLNPEYAPIPMNEGILCNGRVIGILDPSWVVE